jgi:hypothetical protein
MLEPEDPEFLLFDGSQLVSCKEFTIIFDKASLKFIVYGELI